MYEAALIDISVDIAVHVTTPDCGTLCIQCQQSFLLENILQGVLWQSEVWSVLREWENKVVHCS